jgi:protein-disulfide isomerase
MAKMMWALALLLVGTAAQAETVAKVGDRSISLEEVEKRAKPQLIEIEQQRFDVLNGSLEELIRTELLEREAKARGVTVAELFKVEVTDKVPAPSEDDVKKLYEQYKDQIEGSFDDVKSQLVEYIQAQGAAGVQGQFLAGLREKYGVEVSLKPPAVQIDDGGRPAKGPKDAPVTIISFSDYECPFCKRAEETVHQVLAAYPDKIRFVHRDFPLDFHANARPAAQAARCAEEQGKYWEMHEKLFTTEDLSGPGLKALAKGIVADPAKFDTCLDSGKFAEAIDKDVAAGASVGVTGTPAFFVNGRVLTGAQPFEEFKKIIDAELARAK